MMNMDKCQQSQNGTEIEKHTHTHAWGHTHTHTCTHTHTHKHTHKKKQLLHTKYFSITPKEEEDGRSKVLACMHLMAEEESRDMYNGDGSRERRGRGQSERERE